MKVILTKDVPKLGKSGEMRMVADGVAIKVVSERLGHAHPAFTMHTYQHLLPGMSATAAEQFANLVATAGR